MKRWALPGAAVAALIQACVGMPEAKGQSTWDIKRGIAGVPRGVGGQTMNIALPGATAGANAINSRWLYTWGNTPPADVTSGTYNGEYVPMIWSANTSTYQTTVNRILGYASSLNVKYVMGFNEPERSSQANMSVANAITIWDGMDHQFRNAGIKLVSPGVSDDTAGRDWLASFMSSATARGLTVDAIAFHWYGSVNLSNPTAAANSFLSRVDSYYNTYNLPIWVTEFAGMDWNDTISTPDLIAFNAAFLKVAVAGLESRSYVHRYSWWQYGNSANNGLDDTKLIDVSSNVYTPTVIGDSYVPTYGTGSQLDLKDKTPGRTTFYLEGGSLINSAGAAPVTVHAIDAMSGTSTFGGDAGWSVQNGFLRVRAGAALTKSSPGQVTLSNLAVEVAGGVNVSAGTLELGQGLSFTSGTGTYRVSGGTLLISGIANGMSNPIVIQSGGTVIMDSADASTMGSSFTVQSGGTLQIGKLTSTTNVFPDAPTLLSNNGTVTVYTGGTLTNMSGAGSLVAANGELQISTNPAFTGNISVTKGQLVPGNATALGTSAGITTIQGDQQTGNVTLRDGISTGSEPFTILARQGATINTPHIVNAAGTNTIAGAITLSTGGSDWNLQSDSGLLIVSGSIVSSPNTSTRKLKLLGSGSGSFTGAIPLNAGATNSIVKNGAGAWTISGAISGVSTIQVSQGRLTLAGTVAGGTATVASGAVLAFAGTGSANNITSFGGAGSLSFAGNSTNALTGTISSTGLLAVASAKLTLASNAGAAYKTVATVGTLSVTGNGGLVVPPHAGAYPSVLVATQLATISGTVDLTNNDAIVLNGNEALIRSLVAGGQIRSSSASPNAAPFTTLAVFANTGQGGNRYFDSYDGIGGLTTSSVIVKFTYVGDANLDGTLDGSDLVNAIEGFSTGQTGWSNGDFDNSGGPVTAADLSAFMAAYASYMSNPVPLGNGQSHGNGAGMIPEPSAVGLLAAAATLVARPRRRNLVSHADLSGPRGSVRQRG